MALALSDPPAGAAPAHPHRTLRVHGPDDAGRGAVEDYIRGVYARRFGARLDRFPPQLVSLNAPEGIVAAAGYRSALEQPLFLERYLDRPVEQMLAAARRRARAWSRWGRWPRTPRARGGG